MRIAYLALIELDIPNACSIHTREISEQMAVLDNEVHLFLPRPLAMQRWQHVHHHWIRFWGFDPLRQFCFLFEACIRLMLTHRRQAFDLLYLRECEHPYLLIWLSRRLGIPLFVEVNGWLLDDLQSLGADRHQIQMARRGQRSLFSAARGIVADIGGNAANIACCYDQAEEKMYVQELGVNSGLFSNVSRNQARKQLGFDARAFIVLFAGSFHPHHDLRTLIHAFAKARSRISQLTLLLVGDGAQRASTEAWVREEKIKDSVLFAGICPYEGMPIWFAAADILVSPLLKRKVERQNGACATKLWEAMAAGTAVVVTDLPHTSSYPLLSEIAWVAPPEDAEALAGAIVAALQDGETREARIEHARRYVLEHRTWRRAASDTLAFIDRRLRGLI